VEGICNPIVSKAYGKGKDAGGSDDFNDHDEL